ncbi:DUF308 domain-containing protein [Peptostreptococcus equinus]|uniref:DUF308 domain-containing protein n=1 Tax=Peptostreptococcus equinus TaxID=3003601 RepID=A0ABY7JQP4_9FIRM|nr:DUF308 domain-containing protein [Peptostreptococcus sp. CBA3647]WAW14002.1 DUF308 domain-containing protein [Peptostreptococcus sp. CBA3647]
MFLNFNINSLFTKKNSTKLIILGVILLAIGSYCTTKRIVAINIFSWGMALAFLFAAFLALKEYNSLRPYASKKEVNKFRNLTITLVIIALMLIIFPKYMNMFMSMLIGSYIIVNQSIKYFKQSKYYRRITLAFLLKILLGVLLIISPLFLANFLVSILSTISIIFGVYFIVTGINIANERKF